MTLPFRKFVALIVLAGSANAAPAVTEITLPGTLVYPEASLPQRTEP